MIKAEITYFNGKKEIREFGSMKRLGKYVSRSSSVISFEIVNQHV